MATVLASMFLSREPNTVVIAYDSKVVNADDSVGRKARTATLALASLPTDLKALPKAVRDALPAGARIEGDRIMADDKPAKTSK